MRSINTRTVGLALAVLIAIAGSAEAQRGGFGRSGRGGPGGGPGGSPLSVLQEEVVAKELALTDEQKARIEELVESSRTDFSQMMPLMMQMRSAETDEQRDALRKQMAVLARAPAEKAESELKTVLSEQQYVRYKQAGRQRAGMRALLDERETADLGLSDDQKKQLEEKSREVFNQFRELRDLPEEEQQAKRAEFEESLLSVLTPDQRQKWNDGLGAPIEGIAPGQRPRTDAPPSGGPQTAPPTVPSTAPPVASTPPVVAPSGGPPMAQSGGPSAGGGDLLDDMLGALESKPAGPAIPPINPNVASIADFGRGASDGPATSFSFNFRNAPWDTVLSLFAETAGLTLDPTVMPPGAFNYYDKNEYTPAQALDVMNGYLLPRGYLLLQRDRFLVVQDINQGVPPSLVPTVSTADLDSRGGNEMVRVLFDTGQTPASELVNDVTALLGAQGKAVALGASNRLIVEGIVRNVLQVKTLLEDTTRPVGPDGLAFRAFRLNNINARDVEPLVKSLLGVETGLGSTSGSSSSRSSSSRGSSDEDRRRAFFEMMSRGRGGPPGFGGDDRGGDRGSSSGGSSQSQPTSANVTARVAVDDRTNTLLVTAKPSDLEIVSQAVKELDVDDDSVRSASRGGSDVPILRVYKIDDGDLGKIAETLTAMVPGIAINEDNRADQIHVVATPEKHREVAQMVAMITGDTLGHSVAVIPLSRMDAYSAGQIIINMFSANGEESIPSVQADPSGQRLIVRGSEGDVAQVRSLLLQLGETGEAVNLTPAQRGPVRELPLGGADPAETLRLLQRLWNAGHESRLEIVPSPGIDAVDDRPRPPQGAGDDSRASYRQNKNNTYYVFQDGSADTSSSVDEAAGDSNAREIAPGISATVIGDRLVISSSDVEALDSLESLAARLLTQTQSRTRWTVIYLQVADASETATMLGTFFPQASVGSSIIAPSTTAPTTQQLQIIPETRTNALFISGSPAEVADVKEVLRILDSADVPAAYRDRVPRSIPVEYANVGEVASVLESVFADMLPRQTRSTSRGGFGRDEESTTLQPGQLTIGIDEATSRIVVSCNEAVFAQVESLVLDLDAAARDAKRSVRVVNLQNTDPAAVKGVLGTLLPQVSFTTSSSRTSTSSSRTGGDSRGGSSSSSGSDNPFDFFRRMRESRESGGSPFGGDRGGSSFGGPPPFDGFGGFGGFGGRSSSDRGSSGGDRGRGGR